MKKLTREQYDLIVAVFDQIYMDGKAAGLSQEEIEKWTVDDYFEAIEENYVDWD